MKKMILIAFLLFIVKMQAQENETSGETLTKEVVKWKTNEYFGPVFKINATYGTTTPLGAYQSYSKNSLTSTTTGFNSGFTQEISGRYHFNIDAVYQMEVLGAGASFGAFNHEVSDFNFELEFPTLLEGGEIDGTYFGIGPEYTTSLGQFQVTAALRGGILNYSMSTFMSSYNGTDVTTAREIFRSELVEENKSSLVYASGGIKINYPIYKGLHLVGRLDYLTTFGEGVEIVDRYVRPFDADDNGSITASDVDVFINSENIVTENRKIKPSMLNLGIGLQYNIGGLGRKYNPNDISDRPGEQYQKNAILAFETGGHKISIQQAENMYTNYNTILKPPLEELQKERRQDTSYRATEYAFVSIKAMKFYIALLDEVERLNPNQPELSGMIIAFGAYDMDYDPNNAGDEVTVIGGRDKENDDDIMRRPYKYGDYGGRQTVFFAPTYYDDDPKLVGKDEIFKHRPFIIAKDPNSENEYKGTYVPIPFLNFVDNTGVGDYRKFTRQYFGGSEFGGPRQEMDLESPTMPLDGENTSLFFNDLNNMPPKGNNN